MRHLIVHRERALACFAMKYDCVLDREQADFLAELEGKDRGELMLNAPGVPMRNGETIRRGCGCGDHRSHRLQRRPETGDHGGAELNQVT